MYQHEATQSPIQAAYPHTSPKPCHKTASAPVSGKPLDSGFPPPVSVDAYHGVIGDIVRAIEPHTEANNAALMMMALAASGAVLGRNPYYMADGSRHGTNLFTCVVGDSGKARKGTAWARRHPNFYTFQTSPI